MMNRPSLLALTWQTVGSDLLHLGIAYLLALPIGWNREHEDRSAGLRTFPIVAVAACGFTMLGTAMPGATPDSHSRILQGLITGIGFIGGGGHPAGQGGSHRHSHRGQHMEYRGCWRGRLDLACIT
jgi:hypothetical protein